MITEAFDNKSEPIITPEAFFGKRGEICDIAIGTFSREIYSVVLDSFLHTDVGMIKAANRIRPIHLLTVDDMKVIFYLSEIGSTLAGNDIIEISWMTGADKFILFGSAGSLDKEKTSNKYVIPYEAYRDEGMSYHYAPPSDYIKIKNADFLERLFAKLGLPAVKGRIWTTDAMFRETKALTEKRRNEGCIAVEMELAGAQAVCDFHNIELYDFLVTGDVLSEAEYSYDKLYEANHDMDKFFIAVEIVKAIRGI